ncbi:class A beta-lactamase-related serine hydrolase [Arthrobacter frigidicola]|nr:class A beta-lactamase-related serine hydrolase [Arthrobacter frigidicola]
MKISRISVLIGVTTLLATSTATVAGAVPTKSDQIQAALSETMELDRWPAALVAVGGGSQELRTYEAGVVELGSTKEAEAKSQIRIGSSTKTFTAAVMMQLVAEDKVDLDQTVESYLPGVLRHPDVKGEDITVRHLLQHTSGLPDMSDDVARNILEWQHRYISPRASLDLALTHPTTNAPGEFFQYSNANYILAGLIIEAVSGRPLPEQIDERIITPLNLENTYFPDQGEQEIRGEHLHSYIPIGDPATDYTTFDPSWGYGAGAMISTVSDLTEFFSALAQGDVVPADQLEEMQKTIPAAGPGVPADGALWEGTRYGLGLVSFELSCGGVAWGHGGDVPGTMSRVAATADGRAAAVAVTQNAVTAEGDPRLRALVDMAICES